MESRGLDVSIIIVNYNTFKITAECIDSVVEKTEGIDYEIILVDNASTDGSKEHFEKDARVRYLYQEENLGFGRANNLGLQHAQGRNILFLNPDTILVNNAVQLLSSYLDENPEAGACGGNLYDAQMRPAMSFKRIYPGIGDELNNFFFHVPEKLIYRNSWYFNHSGKPVDVAYISGADLMVRRSILQENGAFSPEFFMYYEETDLCIRIRRAGFRLVSVPQAQIQHLEGKSFQSGVNTRRLTISEQSRHIFYKRNYPKVYGTVADAIYCGALLFHQLVYALMRKPAKVQTCRFIRKNLYKAQ